MFRLAHHELADNITFYRERVSRRVQHGTDLGNGLGADWSVVSGVTSTVSGVTKTCLEVACRTGNGRDDIDDDDDVDEGDKTNTTIKTSIVQDTSAGTAGSTGEIDVAKESADEELIPTTSDMLLLRTFEEAATTLEEVSDRIK